jgi:hypothetical protein
MVRNLLMAAFAFFIASAANAIDVQKIPSKVQKVTVFLNGAQVTRTAMVNIAPGVSQLVFSGISGNLDAQSLQVHANGSFMILSVNHALDFLNDQARQGEIENVRANEKAISDKIAMQNNLLAICQAEENMIAKNQQVSGESAGLDVVRLKQALDFQTERLTALKEKELNLNNQIAALNLELGKYDKQIAELGKSGVSATSNIVVTVSSKVNTQAQFNLSYVVRNTSWYPTYDIRVKDVSNPVNISYKANVSQNCGEEWKDVKLTLSTGNPAISGNKPELKPDYLSFGMYYSDPSSAVIGRVAGKVVAADDRLGIAGVSIKIKGTSIGTVSDANGNFSLLLPSSPVVLVFTYIGFQTQEQPVTSSVMNVEMRIASQQLGEVVVTGYGAASDENGYVSESRKSAASYSIASVPVPVTKLENQTDIEFDIDEPYSIPSDGKQYTVDINQVEVQAGYEYAVAPKLSTTVFLTARLTDWNKYNFLSGEANLFYEGTFIGKSLLNTDAVKDTLDISLGTDKSIVVTRSALAELTGKQSLSSNKKDTRDWQIEVKNRKNQIVNLLVEDQVPVSQNSAIEVETQELSGGRMDSNSGKVLWHFTLNPNDDKKVELKYQVKYPKNQSVIVQ